jgi:uncharacterized protein YcbK (DUF882 family)
MLNNIINVFRKRKPDPIFELAKHKLKVIELNMYLTKNFTLKEFASKDGSDFPLEVIPNIQKLAAALQIIRDELNLPMSVGSGYRSKAHNNKVGGAKRSLHLTGMAADIKVKGKSPAEVVTVILKLIASGKIPEGGLKGYNTFTHYDIRGFKARW